MVLLFLTNLLACLQLWQVFVGANDRRVDGYYQDLLARQGGGGEEAAEVAEEVVGNGSDEVQPQPVVEKWTNQIEKVRVSIVIFCVGTLGFDLCVLGMALNRCLCLHLS